MKYNSVFEIIGPIMVGPSSSHTAGAVRIGNLARQILSDKPQKVDFGLMGSFAETYQGHGTDLALLAGVLGLSSDHPDVVKAKERATRCGLEYQIRKTNLGFFHPNTVSIHIEGKKNKASLIASSLGGGKVEVQELDDLSLKFTAEKPTIIFYHRDEKGFLESITRILHAEGHNIMRLALERRQKFGAAITVCELDESITNQTLQEFKKSVANLTDIRVVQVN